MIKYVIGIALRGMAVILMMGAIVLPQQSASSIRLEDSWLVPDGSVQADWQQIKALIAGLSSGFGQTYLKASNAGDGDYFGLSVAISGDTVVVGAYDEDGEEDTLTNSGAAYVFVRSGGVWSEQAYLKASNAGAGDLFGNSVAISGDTIVVGAYGEAGNGIDESNDSLPASGAAYVFTRSAGVWSQQGYLKASNPGITDLFGTAVAISGDTVVVGAYCEDGNDNTLTNSGAAYVFTRSSETWSQQAYLKASNVDAYDNFGISTAVSGNTLVVGAYGEDSNGSDEGNDSAVSAGAAYVYTRSGTAWNQQDYLKASYVDAYDYFGVSVSISGDTLVVGAEGEDGNGILESENSVSYSGAAYVFDRSGTDWSQQAYLKASNLGVNDSFGYSVAIAGDTIAVGSYGEDSNGGSQSDNSASDSGAAYVFKSIVNTWSQMAYLKASNAEANDYFGNAIGVSEKFAIVGASEEDSDGSSPLNNSAESSGAIYLFDIRSKSYLPLIIKP